MSLNALSAEQKAMIAANRERALRIREEMTRAQPVDTVASSGPSVAAGVTVASAAPTVRPVRSESTTSSSSKENVTVPSPTKSNSGGYTASEAAIRERNREMAVQRRLQIERERKELLRNPPPKEKGNPVVDAVIDSIFANMPPPPPPSITSTSTSNYGASSSWLPPRPDPVEEPPKAVIKWPVTCEFAVLSPERFKITMRPFNRSVIEAVKTVPSRNYEMQTKLWDFALDDMQRLKKVLSEIPDADVTVKDIPSNVTRALTWKDKKSDPSTSLENLTNAIDPSLYQMLFAYQRKGVHFGLEKGGRVLIADEMGLGKSVQALAIARYYRTEWPLVIVCPSSVKSAWKGQIDRFLPCVHRLHIVEKEKDPLPEDKTSNTVIILSYDMMQKRRKQLAEESYKVYIFDESHYLKDAKAQRTKAALELAKAATRVILLSGTPALSRPAELFTQIKLVNDRLFPVFRDFGDRYCDGKEGRFGYETKGCTNSEELCAVMQKRLMIRRLKSEVLKDLPPKIREIVYLESGEIETSINFHKEQKDQFERLNSALKNKPLNSMDPSLLEYYTMTGSAKAKPVCKHIADNYFYDGAPERKVLIFAHHLIVLDSIGSELAERDIGYIRIDGCTPSHSRGELCRQFQEDPRIRVAVLSITAAGQGITLTAANVVVFAEIYWIPGSLLQAEDRAHRVGQVDSVFVQYMLARNTADDLIWPMVQNKLQVLGQVNLNSESFAKAERKHKTLDDEEWEAGEETWTEGRNLKKKKKFK